MKVLMTGVGSLGDFLPTLALGEVLAKAGHQVRFVGNPFYESHAGGAGLRFLPAGPRTDVFEEVEANPHYLDMVRGGKALLEQLVVPNAIATYRAMKDAVQEERPDVIVCSNIAFSGIWVAAEAGIPSVLVAASPMIWMNSKAPVRLVDANLPMWVHKGMTWLTRHAMNVVFGRFFRRLARQVGTTAPDPSFAGTDRMAALHLGLWSPAMRPAVPGDPPRSVVCGFARASHLGHGEFPVASEVRNFLAAGAPPVIVGLGSIYSRISGALLHDLAAASEALGLRCLVVGHPSDMKPLPPHALAVAYAPYHEVFPRAAIVVVHGGAGSTLEALRSSRPVLALPFAYDQFAIAAEVEKLGAGMRVSRRRRTVRHLAGVLRRLTQEPVWTQRAAEASAALNAEPDGATVAVGLIEKLIRS